MTQFIALWSHLLAAALYGALAVFQIRRWNGDPRNRPLVSAFAAMLVWTIFSFWLVHAMAQPPTRNLAFSPSCAG